MAAVNKHHKCERCPHEHTRQCESCNPDKQPEEITVEKAIKYFEEENKRYSDLLGTQVYLVEEYRMNILAINALKKVTL